MTKLKDPGSAQFEALRLVRRADGSPSVVCGRLNAKNSYGAYTGFARFVFLIDSGSVVIEGGDGLVRESNELILNNFC